MIHRSNEMSHGRRAKYRPAVAVASLMVLGASLLLGLTSSVQAGSIFDDNWTPPKAVKPPELPGTPTAPNPANPAHPTNPATPTSPADSGKTPPTVVTPPDTGTPPATNTPPTAETQPLAIVTAPPARRAIPAAADQAKSRKLFKEIFATELADRSPAARRALGTKLLAQAAAVGDAPADQFVLLVGATEAGKEASDLGLCSRAADALADGYDVDALRVKSDLATKMTLRADNAGVTTANCRAGLKLVDELVSMEDYITATRLLKSLRTAAPDGPLSAQIQSRIKELDALRLASERVTPFILKLKTAPDDAAANLAVGQYLCFMKDDWKRGLPLLLKGGKPALSAAAMLDRAGASEPEKQAEVGDAWWMLAEKEGGTAQVAMRQRAASWYGMALQTGSGLGMKRVLLEKRIAATPPKGDGSSALAASGAPVHVTILSAEYGNGTQTASAMDAIQKALDADPYTPIGVGNGWVGPDPAPGAPKSMIVKYQIGDQTHDLDVPERNIFILPPIPDDGVVVPGASMTFKVIAARRGDENRWTDVTDEVRTQMKDPSTQIKAPPTDGGGGGGRGGFGNGGFRFRRSKHLVVYYEINGRRFAKVTAEADAMGPGPR